LLLLVLALVAVTVLFQMPFLLFLLVGLWFVTGGCRRSRRHMGHRSRLR